MSANVIDILRSYRNIDTESPGTGGTVGSDEMGDFSPAESLEVIKNEMERHVSPASVRTAVGVRLCLRVLM